MSTTNQICTCRSYKNDQSVCIIASHGIVTKKSWRKRQNFIDFAFKVRF